MFLSHENHYWIISLAHHAFLHFETGIYVVNGIEPVIFFNIFFSVQTKSLSALHACAQSYPALELQLHRASTTRSVF